MTLAQIVILCEVENPPSPPTVPRGTIEDLLTMRALTHG